MTRIERFQRALGRSTLFSLKSRRRLYQRLEKFVSRGHALRIPLEGMFERFSRTGDSRRFIVRELLQGVLNGDKFSKVISPHVPAAERLMVAAGELSGRQQDGFRLASHVAQTKQTIKSAIISSLAYPVLLALMLCGLLALISIQTVPTMQDIQSDLTKWPAASLSLKAVADFTTSWGWLVAVAAVIFAALIARSMPRWIGPTRAFFDRWVPPYTLYREIQSSSFLIALAALTASGRPIEASMQNIQSIGTRWLRSHVNRMLIRLSEGVPPGRALDTGLLHAEVVGDIEDYGRAGAFNTAIGALGEEAVIGAIARIESSAMVVRVALILFVSATVIWVWGAIAALNLAVSAAMGNGTL